MSWNRKLTVKEFKFLKDSRYVIRPIYIGPEEGYEYHVYPMGAVGSEYLIAIKKSPRAAFNALKKHLDEQKRTIK